MKLKYLPIILLVFVFSCNKQEKKEIDKPETRTKVEMVTDYGTMLIELYNETPKHRDNFIKIAEDGVLDSLLFHRVINNFMIQSGDINSKYAKPGDSLGYGELDYTVEAEFHPDLFHKKGVLAAARDNNPERASSSTQFYLVQGQIQNDSLLEKNQNRINGWLAEYYVKKDTTYIEISNALENAIKQEDWDSYKLYNDSIKGIAKTYTNYIKYKIPKSHQKVYKKIGGTPHLDQNYTVFGEVMQGIEVIGSIAGVETNDMDRPINDVRIRSVKVLENK